jgi:hypothetical protein
MQVVEHELLLVTDVHGRERAAGQPIKSSAVRRSDTDPYVRRAWRAGDMIYSGESPHVDLRAGGRVRPGAGAQPSAR